MKQLLNVLRDIEQNGIIRGDRTGVGTQSLFVRQMRFDLKDGFPAVTTKKLAWKVMSSELLWFISGSGNINDLKAIYKHNKIWDANYEDYLKRLGLEENDGDMGRVYGVQWRRWRTADGREIDQLQKAIDLIKNNPDSRRIIVNTWNPGEVGPHDVALPPCPSFFQFYVEPGRGSKKPKYLSLSMYQRSCDMFLGVPFNIASYTLLLCMVAQLTGLEPKECIITLGDAHIYLDAIDQVKEQLGRSPFPLPQLHIEDRGQKSIDDFLISDFALINYECHEVIKAKMAV